MGFQKLYGDLHIYENPNDRQSRQIGHIMSIKLEKLSNSGNVNATASIPFVYNHGIHRVREIATLAEGYALIGRKGAWYTLDDKNIAQGYNKLLQYLDENKDVAERLENEIKKTVGL
jgi:recombination protein RecA